MNCVRLGERAPTTYGAGDLTGPVAGRLAAAGCTAVSHRSSAVGGGLDAEQLGVLAVEGHQVFVAAELDDVGAVHHDDEIGHSNGREPVRHQHRDAAGVDVRARRLGEPLEQGVLGLGVERSRRLVEASAAAVRRA